MTDIIENESTRKECMEAVLQLGCCPRCALRFMGDESQQLYQMSTKDILNHLDINIDALKSSPDNTVCVACLGILQDKYCSDNFCSEIADTIKKQDNEFTDYYIALSTPVSLLLRDHSIWIHLQEKFPAIYKDDVRDKILTIKEVWRFYNSDSLSECLGQSFCTTSCFTITLNFVHTVANKECNFLFDIFPGVFKRRKGLKHGCEVFNRTNVSKAIKDLSNVEFKRNYSCPPRILNRECMCTPITGAHEAIFVAGRYNKYSRSLSQTEWIIDGERKTESSIEEMILGPLNRHIKADSLRFSSSGREDVDVKMLGNGRPFLFECVNPHRVFFTQNHIDGIQEEINNSTKAIAVKHLQLVLKEDTRPLKEGEIDKKKCYSAVCWSENVLKQEDLDVLKQLKDLVVQQTTPVRVLHRRPLAVREKTIHSIEAKILNNHHFLMKLDTQAGTYIKEFVHGDFGRTLPNLCSLLNTECDILQLDVQAVLLDWPKEMDVKSSAEQSN